MEFAWVALASTAFACFFSYPVIARLGTQAFTGGLDWDFVWQLEWTSFYSVAQYHQLPLWNPYKCGGMPLLANPQSRILTPFFLLHLLFGPLTGLLLEIPLHLAASWAGGYLLARMLGLKPIARLTCASIFPASSWLYVRLAVGHVTFVPSLYFPWVALFAYLSMTRRRLTLAMLSGLVVALMFGEGAVYPISQALLLVAVLAVSLVFTGHGVQPLVALATICVSTAGFGAIKLLPSYALVHANPRIFGSEEAISIAAILAALLSSNQDWSRPKVGYWGFWEYGAHIGVSGAALVAGGCFTSLRRAFPWIALAALSLALSIGDAAAYSPWALLHHLPVFSSQRVPTRFLILAVFAFGVVAAHGADWLERQGKLGALFASVLFGATVGSCWLTGPHNLNNMFNAPHEVMPVSPSFHHVAVGDGRMLALSRANLGLKRCYDYAVFTTTVMVPEEPDYHGEEYFLGGGTVRLIEWSPNKLRYEVHTPAPDTLVINQSYYPGWRVASGHGEVASVGGLIGVRVPAGAQRLTVAYRPLEFYIGSLITLASVLVLLLLWRRESASRGSS